MAQPARETLTVVELLSLFHHQGEDSRWISLADSNEYLGIVLYVMERNSRER